MKSSSITSFMLFFLFINITIYQSDSDDVPSSLHSLDLPTLLHGHFTSHDIHQSARDFGNIYQFIPSAVLHPGSVADIAATIKHVFEAGASSKMTVAARGHGHSLQGQAQALGGIVVQMESLQGLGVRVHNARGLAYVDASGGELWINVLKETLKYGLAPKSWTDYLHLTIGGTLSNAGVSGQTFRHGPQISNVHQLEIVTGKGEVLTCSEAENADLFYGVLGGLGQFGIITRARIALEPAPKMVKWIRVLYSDFTSFTEDQEMLISAEKTFDYLEGFVIINRTGILNNWRLSFNAEDGVQANNFDSDGKTLFCLEMTRNYNPDQSDYVNKEVEVLLSRLRYIPSTLFKSEVSYLEFLNRVHVSEVKLRSKGLWEVPHPWLNLLVPKTQIHNFAREVFGKILTDSNSGPILIYPVSKSKWDNRTSVVIPDEDVFYLVGILSSVPSSSDYEGLERSLKQNQMILDFCVRAKINMKQYLPHYRTQEEWKAHFGSRWELFVRRKNDYDPMAILAPGQRIFMKSLPSS